jgi:PKD repeat protein
MYPKDETTVRLAGLLKAAGFIPELKPLAWLARNADRLHSNAITDKRINAYCDRAAGLYGPPVAALSSSVAGLSVEFTSTGDAGEHTWFFGDGTTSSETNPTHVYAAAGAYTVILTVDNGLGIHSVAQTVTVTT